MNIKVKRRLVVVIVIILLCINSFLLWWLIYFGWWGSYYGAEDDAKGLSLIFAITLIPLVKWLLSAIRIVKEALK